MNCKRYILNLSMKHNETYKPSSKNVLSVKHSVKCIFKEDNIGKLFKHNTKSKELSKKLCFYIKYKLA